MRFPIPGRGREPGRLGGQGHASTFAHGGWSLVLGRRTGRPRGQERPRQEPFLDRSESGGSRLSPGDLLRSAVAEEMTPPAPDLYQGHPADTLALVLWTRKEIGGLQAHRQVTTRGAWTTPVRIGIIGEDRPPAPPSSATFRSMLLYSLSNRRVLPVLNFVQRELITVDSGRIEAVGGLLEQ